MRADSGQKKLDPPYGPTAVVFSLNTELGLLTFVVCPLSTSLPGVDSGGVGSSGGRGG